LYYKVGGNNIGNEGVIALGDALAENNSLMELTLCKYLLISIDNNRIEDEGVIKLIERMKGNKTLNKLALERNPITEKGYELLKDWVKERSYITLRI